MLILSLSLAAPVWALADSTSPDDWYERARGELEVAQLLLEKTTRYETVCFHAHQAVEKSLKGALWGRGVAPGKTHLTRRLLADLAEYRTELLPLETSCRELDRIYTASRYPKEGFSFDSVQAADCLKKAESLVEASQEKLQSKHPS